MERQRQEEAKRWDEDRVTNLGIISNLSVLVTWPWLPTSGNDSGQWEKNYQSVCALGIVHGGWEEDLKEIFGSSVFPQVF